jgi:hypothetical protein
MSASASRACSTGVFPLEIRLLYLYYTTTVTKSQDFSYQQGIYLIFSM